MNTTTSKIVTIVIAFALGFAINQFYVTHDMNNKYADYAELHKTKSGTFIIQKDRIYTVSELTSEEHVAVNLVGRN
jgi:hypothetical protein